MNYQGALVRKDIVWSGIVFWFLVRYYPYLSAALLLCLLVSTYWESTTENVSRVAVHLFKGKISTGGSKSGKQKDANVLHAATDLATTTADFGLPTGAGGKTMQQTV